MEKPRAYAPFERDSSKGTLAYPLSEPKAYAIKGAECGGGSIPDPCDGHKWDHILGYPTQWFDGLCIPAFSEIQTEPSFQLKGGGAAADLSRFQTLPSVFEMEEDEIIYVVSLLESAAEEASYGNAEDRSDSKICLSPDLLQKLFEVFGRLWEDRGGSKQLAVDGDLWEELASRRVSLGAVVNGLIGTMEKRDRLGVQASRVYLGLLLAPGCPSYSIFSPLALQVLLRCIHSSCKPIAENIGATNNRKKALKRGKRAREVEEENHRDDDITFEQEREGASVVALEEVISILCGLQAALHVIHLKEHQETLRTLIELLVELPHLVADIHEPEKDDRSLKCRRGVPRANSEGYSTPAVIKLTFSMLKDTLEPCHGDVTTTAVTILKMLTPSLLLTQSGGNSHQRLQVRTSALDFVVNYMLRKGCKAIQTTVVALSRYLCFKAPEKTDARAQAVESVIVLVKALSLQEQRQFGKFVAKLVRGKARYRLLALDICAGLFAALPDPLGLDSNPEGECENQNVEEERTYPKVDDEAENVDNCSTKGKDYSKRDANYSKCSSSTGSWWGIACLEAVLQRCSDKVPAIRARALTTLAHALELLSEPVRQRIYLQQLLGLKGVLGSNVGTSTADAKASNLDAWETPFQDIAALGSQTLFTVTGTHSHTAALLSPGAYRGDFGSLLRKRCTDDKAAVRKAALILMTKATILMGRPPDEETLQAMGTACSDSMVSIRKAALGALSEVTRKFCKDKKVVTEWLHSALPLVIDNELSIQEEVVGLFQELVLDPIASVSVLKISNRQLTSILLERSQEPERSLPPGVLHVLSGLADGNNIALLVKRICTRLGKKKGLRASVIMALQNIIAASEELGRKKRSSDFRAVESIAQGAWFLLAEVSCFLPKVVGWDFLRTHWQLLDKQGPSRPDEENTPVPFSSCTKGQFQESASWAASRVHLLQTIANVAVELPPDAAVDLADELLKHLEDFNMHPAEVGAHVNALTVLCRRKAASLEEGEELVAEWVSQLLHKAEGILKAYVSIGEENNYPFQTPVLTSKRKSAARRRSGNPVRSKRRRKVVEVLTPAAQIVTAIFTIGATVLVCPALKTSNIVSLLQALITEKSYKKTKGKHMAGTRLQLGMETAVCAQAWVTLGKLCLADDRLAKRLIPLFVEELESTQSAAIRNNIMVAMTDFCVRYTALIDGYIPKLTKSLRDSCEIVRRQAFVLLARLLQRDYVKWRGMLFHRFLLALVDDSPKICQMADFLFGNILKTKAPLLAYNSFVEAIFVLNDYQGHSSGSAVLQTSESERDLFSLRGNSQAVAAKRMHIYAALLKQMTPEHLLATSAKLCAEVVAGAADGLVDINIRSGQCVLEDALKILASKEMRIVGNKTAPNGVEHVDEEDGAATFAVMKGKVVTQLAKKNLVQNAIPIFIELKRLLEKRSSPLLGVLMECMRVMLKDYKNEIEEILVADKQLQKEIMYDIQKHEAAKARAKVEAATAKVVPPEPLKQQAPNASSGPLTSDNADAAGAAGRGKEKVCPDFICMGPAGAAEPSRPSDFSAMKGEAVAVATPIQSRPGPSRVTWLDQTPQLNRGALGGGTGAFTSLGSTSNAVQRSHSTAGKNVGGGRMGIFSPKVLAASQIQSIAGAVGDIAAAATAASVLQEVATGKSTPLRAMSLPRLRADVSVSAQRGPYENAKTEKDVVLDTVRRRQSFDSMEEPSS